MQFLKDLIQEVEVRHLGKWLFLGGLIGIVAGGGAAFFFWLLTVTKDYFLGHLVGMSGPTPAGEGISFHTQLIIAKRWLLLVIPAIGGLISGFLIYTFAPEAEGHGTDAVIEAFHRKRGVIRPIVPFIKTIASAVTIGTGGSAGREGPIAQIGSGFGSILAKFLKLSTRDRRILIMVGAGAGVGAIFRAPLGGALFAAEVLYRNPVFESDVIIPAIIASIFAYIVYGLFFSYTPIFSTTYYNFNAKELPFFGLLGLLLVPFGFIYVKTFYKVRDIFKSLSLPNHIKPMIGGFLTGIVIFVAPQVAATSYGWVQMALYGKMAGLLLLGLAFAKILATAFTIGAGGSGGVFAPSLAIGAFIGGAFGQFVKNAVPSIVQSSSAFAIVGMGSFFAAVGKVPLASLVMVIEMTGNYGLLVPMTLALTLAYLFSGKWSIYENQVPSRIDSPAHQGEFLTDVLEDIKVKDAVELPMDIKEFTRDAKITDALREVAHSQFRCFPVVDENHKVIGYLYEDDLRSVIYTVNLEELEEVLVAEDVMRNSIPTLKPEDNLQKALQYLITRGVSEIPIVDENGRCLGVISRRDIIRAYSREIWRRKHEGE